MSIGRQNCHQILTEMDADLRSLFIPSKLLTDSFTRCFLKQEYYIFIYFLIFFSSQTCLGSFRYVEKRWAKRGEVPPASRAGEIIGNLNEAPAGRAKSGISKINRRLSLEESILTSHMAQILPPVTRTRGVTMFSVKSTQSFTKNVLIGIHVCAIYVSWKFYLMKFLTLLVICAVYNNGCLKFLISRRRDFWFDIFASSMSQLAC